jgi:hypothetical protein
MKDRRKGIIMKRILKILSFVVVGCILGFVLGSLNSYRAMSYFSSTALTEMAIDVHQLQQGDSNSVLERKREALPVIVQQLESCHRKFLSEAQWNRTLWAVSRCYENQGAGPPASIKHLLDALPPRPLTSCQITPRPSEEKKTEENESAAEPNVPANRG